MPKRESIFEEGVTGAQKVAAFLSKAGVFYVGTTEENQPKIRAFSWYHYDEEKDQIVFSTGTFKNVFRQMQENPKIEIFALIGGYFMRYDGTFKYLDDDSIRKQVGQDSPGMKKTYQENGWTFAPFCLENGHVEIRYSLDPVEEFDV